MKYLVILAIAITVAIAVISTLIIRIGPDETGVLTRNLGSSGRGIVAQDFGPGWYWSIPLVHTWNIFPARVRRVEMTRDPRQQSLLGGEPLLVQSGDGDRVLINLDIFYRIQPEHAHNLLEDSGVGDAHVRTLKSLANDRLRAIFGTMRTEEFYDPVARYARSREGLDALREALEPRFLEIVDILVENIEFEPKYEQKIKDKKLADQNVELNIAQTKAVTAKAAVATIEIETAKQVKLIETTSEAEVAAIKAEASKYSAEKRGEADIYQAQLRAKGALALAEAEAKVKQAKSHALGASGGANLVALEAVTNLKIDSISFPTAGTDWFDVHEMARRLGAIPAAGNGAEAKP